MLNIDMMVISSLISIHALREESDLSLTSAAMTSLISIHALREESDPDSYPAQHTDSNFNPRSP